MAGHAVLLVSKALSVTWALFITKDHESNLLGELAKTEAAATFLPTFAVNKVLIIVLIWSRNKINIYLCPSIQQILMEYFTYSRIRQQADCSKINQLRPQ